MPTALSCFGACCVVAYLQQGCSNGCVLQASSSQLFRLARAVSRKHLTRFSAQRESFFLPHMAAAGTAPNSCENAASQCGRNFLLLELLADGGPLREYLPMACLLQMLAATNLTRFSAQRESFFLPHMAAAGTAPNSCQNAASQCGRNFLLLESLADGEQRYFKGFIVLASMRWRAAFSTLTPCLAVWRRRFLLRASVCQLIPSLCSPLWTKSQGVLSCLHGGS